jgi:hypothetical protein
VRRDGESLLDGLPGQEAGTHHHGRIGGVGAARYGGDNGGTMREVELLSVHRNGDGPPRLGPRLPILGLAAGRRVTLVGHA